ncbi:hypothetical protein Barb4_05318 [Bacteroidales bacterium Barb4]|nr:hypothetical protein Barb4_05318 [Bacteroidales bacterium Barb4]
MVMNKHYFVRNGCKVVCKYFLPFAKCFAIIFRLTKLSKTAIPAFHIADVYKKLFKFYKLILLSMSLIIAG